MAERPRSIAKLTRPAGGDLLKRERLFAALDAATKGVWLAAPGGAGKTSLVASWLEARARRSLWYSLDAGDGDPASFFYYLGTAARRDCGVFDLPPFAESQPLALGLFARRYFERLFAAIEPPFAVVLDDYQELARNSPVHEVTDALLDSAPPMALVVITSRAEPPPPLARWSASAEMHSIDWRALRFTPEETVTLVSARGGDATKSIAALYELSRGWAAGVVMLARAIARGIPLPRRGAAPPDTVFDYFAREVYAGAAPDAQTFLLRTAFLPYMTATMASYVGGEPRAAEILADFHRSHLFTERKEGPEALYEYHPLFREYLQAEARAAFDRTTLDAIRTASASALAARGDVDAALPLLAANEDWPEFARVIRVHAPQLVAYGRHAHLAAWLAAVPEAVLEREPWLQFWLGWCRTVERATGSRAMLARAFAGFERAGDVEGAFTSCAWLLRTSVLRDEAERWIEAVERLAAAHPRFADAETEARIITQFRQVQQFPPHHPLVERWTVRAESLARSLDDTGWRLRMATYALCAHFAQGEVHRMAALVAETRALAERNDAPPSELAIYSLFCGLYHLHIADEASALALLARTEQLAESTGSIADLVLTYHYGCRVALLAGDLALARDYYDRVQRLGDFPPPHALHYGVTTVHLRLAERDLGAALAAARAALDATTTFPVFQPLARANYAQVLLARGDARAARVALDRAIADARTLELPATECVSLLLRAAALFRISDDTAATASLSEGLAICRTLGCVPQSPPIVQATLAQLAARALEHGIEREFVGEVVARWRLASPSPDEERWPWPVRVRTLGAFEVALGDEPLVDAGKTQRRPLDLLKCLIAHGGRDVSIAALAHALWPDAEGDAAKRSFDITLHRLRRLLGRGDAIVIENGKLALNAGVIWVDALAFDRLAARAEGALNAANATVAPSDESFDRTLRLYRGGFLASDDDLWVEPMRERLRGRHLHLVERVGENLEQAARYDAALACYERAVTLDPPAERIYRRLIRSLHAMGRSAEAIEAYARCTRILHATLGARPSSETEALRELLRSG